MANYCNEGQEPTVIYQFKDGGKKEYKSKVSPIEVSVKEAPIQGTENYNFEGFEISFDIPFNPSVRIVVRDYMLFTYPDPNNPSIIYDVIKFISCDATEFDEQDLAGIGVYPETIVINPNIKCPNPAENKCTIEVKHEGQIIFKDQGNCPCSFKVKCGNCDEGFIECPHPGYPGYCCIDCKGSAAKINSLAQMVEQYGK